MRPRRKKKRPPEVPSEAHARREYIERIGHAEAAGWRERVFAFLFDPSPGVRDEASEWLCLEPEAIYCEHELTLADRSWLVRYNAPSGWFLDPDCEIVPEWMPDLYADALARERDGTVFRQLVRAVGRWAPERIPSEVPHRVRERRDYATVGLALAEIEIGRASGWPRLHALFADPHNLPGVAWAAMVLANEVEEDRIKVPTRELLTYVEALAHWCETQTLYPRRMRDIVRDAETLETWMNAQDPA